MLKKPHYIILKTVIFDCFILVPLLVFNGTPKRTKTRQFKLSDFDTIPIILEFFQKQSIALSTRSDDCFSSGVRTPHIYYLVKCTHHMCTRKTNNTTEKHGPILPSFPAIWLWLFFRQYHMIKVWCIKQHQDFFVSEHVWAGGAQVIIWCFTKLNITQFSASYSLLYYYYYISTCYWSEQCSHSARNSR